MKTSTSRESRVKHSTGNNETMTEDTKLRRSRPRTSTGEKATINHFTGRLFDLQRQDEAQEEESTKQKPSQAA